MSNAIVKNLSFGSEAKNNVFAGITKLTQAVSSTLGASGKCVMLEDQTGEPIITKDGVTVADAITLLDPVENMGATLLRQAARKTVREAGDGTTTATVLAHAILEEAYRVATKENARDLKKAIETSTDKVVDYLNSIVTTVKGDMIDQVATISTNNDPELGKIIADAFRSVDQTGVVILEVSDLPETKFETIDGIQYDRGLKNIHFVTNQETKTAELDKPLVLIVESEVENVRKIQSVLEYAIKTKRSLLIIFLAIIFVSLSVYLYNYYVSSTLDPDFVENKELQNGMDKQSDVELYLFYTTWCPHCTKSKPEWNKLKSEYQEKTINNTVVYFREIDCDKEKDVAEKFNVDGYPTIKLVKNGKVIDYDAKPEYNNLVQFLHEYL